MPLLELRVCFTHTLECKAAADVRSQQACVDESGNSGEDATRALRIELLRSRYAHELIVHRDVSVQQALAAIAGIGAEYGDDLPIHRCTVETLEEHVAAHRIEDHGQALACGELAYPFDDVLASVVYDLVRVQHVAAECDR